MPQRAETFDVVEPRPAQTTHYGVPGAFPAADKEPLDAAGLVRFGSILAACRETFDAAAAAAVGIELRKGPARRAAAIWKRSPVTCGSRQGHPGSLAGKMPKGETANLNEEMRRTRQTIMDVLAAAEQGKIPERRAAWRENMAGRATSRRVAWHVLDHAGRLRIRLNWKPCRRAGRSNVTVAVAVEVDKSPRFPGSIHPTIFL